MLKRIVLSVCAAVGALFAAVSALADEPWLPDGYDALEYAKGNANAVVDTGIVVGKTDEVQFKVAFETVSGYSGVFGNYPNPSDENASVVRIISNNGSKTQFLVHFFTRAGGGGVVYTLSKAGDPMEGYIRADGGNINGTSLSFAGKQEGGANSTPLRLFSASATASAKTKIWYLRILDEQKNVIHDYVPVRETATGTVKMYDKVAKEFPPITGSPLEAGPCVPLTEPDTYTWTAPVAGNWEDGTKWTTSAGKTGYAPHLAGDVVIIPGAETEYTVTVNQPFTAGSLSVGTNATLCFSHREMNTVGGDVHVLAGGVITHTALPSTVNVPKDECYRVALQVGGDMTIDEGAKIYAKDKGYALKKGPGYTDLTPNTNLGAHQSAAHASSCYSETWCYGSLVCPTNCGSGSDQGVGGGSVRLNVAGSLTINGTVTVATLDRSSGFRSGAAGSIWLTCAELLGEGTGALDASAGCSGYSFSGGGGRIAVHLTEATDFSNWHGTMKANGGAWKTTYKLCGGAGTIYLQAAGETPETATVIVDNAGGYAVDGSGNPTAGQSYGYTLLTDKVGAGIIGNLIITNHAQVVFAGADATTRIYGDIDTATGEILAYEGTVELSGDRTQTIRGAALWDDFKCTVPGKTVRVGTDAGDALNFRETSVVTLAGSAETNLVLAPVVPGESWKFTLPVGGVAAVSYAAVDGSDASGGITITTKNSADNGGNRNWIFPKPMAAGDPITWTGEESTDWNNMANWVDKYGEHRTPIADDKVVVPAGCDRYPVVPNAFCCWGLDVRSGATLTIDRGVFFVSGMLTVAGTLVFTGAQTLEISAPTASFAGATIVPADSTVRILDGVEQIDFGSSGFNYVEIVRSGGTLALSAGLRAKSFYMRVTDSTEVVFAAGCTLEAGMAVCSCSAVAEGKCLSLKSAESGTAWYLKTPQSAYMTGVRVSDSTASGATAIASLSANDGRNTNWTFDADLREWVGGTDDKFETAANWSPVGVPTDTTDVYIPSSARNPSLTKPTSVRSLIVGGDRKAVRFTVGAELSVADSVTVGAGAIVVIDKPMSVSNDFFLLSGGTLTHTALPSTANEPKDECNRLVLNVDGDMTIDKGAIVDAKDKGYAKQKGPGHTVLPTPSGLDKSAAHGGSCCSETWCYGSLSCPTNCGSGAENAVGGGSVRLNVGGNLTINGTVTVATSDQSSRSGAAGSIWFTCAELLGEGTGALDASAGCSDISFSGGGGRIAVHLTEATDFSNWHGTMKANGGAWKNTYKLCGGAGTIYMQAAGESPETATVVVDNAGGYAVDGSGNPTAGQSYGYTLLSDKVGAGVIGNLIITNHAQVAFAGADATTRIYGDIDTTTGEILAYEGTVELSGDRTQTIRGAALWDDIKCTVPGKTIKIGTGAGAALNFRATSVVTLSGSLDNHLVLTPAVADETWKMMLPVGGQAEVSYVTVDHSDASGVGVVGITAKNSTDGGNNVNWAFPKPMLPGDAVTWTGAIDSDWNKADNWKDKYDDARLPTADDKVVVPAGCANWPRVPSEMSFWGIVVDTNAQLTIAGGPLSVTNELRVAGTLAFSGHQTLKVSAPTASFADGTVVPGEGRVRILDGVDTFDPGNCTFCRVEIPLNGGSLVLTDGLKARLFEVRATDDATLVFAAGKTIEAETIVCSCMEDGKHLTLQSSAANEKWFLKSPRVSYMTGVSVSDSTAANAAAVASLSVNNGRNTNWKFANGVSEWVGGASGKFDVAANWYPSGVPSATSDVLLRGAAEITADGNVSVRSLTLLPDEVKASLTVKGALTTVGDAVIGTNATLTLSTARDFNEIGGDFIVGGTVTHPELSSTATTIADGENGAKVLVRAKNVVVEYGAKIDTTAKGYQTKMGPGKSIRNYQLPDGTTIHTAAGHGGTYVAVFDVPTTNSYWVLNDYRAYGSMFEPTTYGSGGESTRGGGVIRLDVEGDVTVNGEIRADGADLTSVNGFTGAGGSVWISAGGTLRGTGVISASGGLAGKYWPGGGGRLAVYAGAKSFSGRLTASGRKSSDWEAKSTMSPPPGTVLVKLADEENYSLTLDYDEYDSLNQTMKNNFVTDPYLCRNATDIPTEEDLDKLDLFKRTSITCGNLTVLNLTCDLKLYDLNFTEAAGSKARLNLHTLKLLSSAHKKGRGWAVAKQGDDPIATHIWPCEKDGAKGKIVWSGGMALIIR